MNKAIIIGNLGKDPEVRQLESGNTVCNITVATTERGYKKRDGTEVPDRTDWHNVVLWAGLAQVAEKFLRKGSKVMIEGKICTRSYEDANGVKKYVTEIFANNMEMLSSAKTSSESQEESVNNTDYIDDMPF